MKETMLFDSALFPLTLVRCSLEKEERLEEGNGSSLSFYLCEEGDMSFFFPETVIPLVSGGAVYVNRADQLDLRANSDSTYTRLSFQRSLGDENSFTKEKYLDPLFASQLEFAVLSKQSALPLIRAVDIIERGAFGYELSVLSSLYEIFSIIAYEKQDMLKVKKEKDERLERMLSFMQSHLDEKLTLPDIAGAGYVSLREASRLFERHLGTSPMKYSFFHVLQEALRYFSERVAGSFLKNGRRNLFSALSTDCALFRFRNLIGFSVTILSLTSSDRGESSNTLK